MKEKGAKSGLSKLISWSKRKKVSGKKAIVSREKRARRFAKAIGAEEMKRPSAGRPFGTFKYGMPIHQWKRLMAQRRAVAKGQQMQQFQRLRRRGLTPEQIAEIQLLRTKQEAGGQVKGAPEEELEMQEFLAKNTVSPNTQSLLDRLRRTQLKGQRDDVNQQRVLYERKLLSNRGNLMKAHENMRPIKLDFTGVDPNDNILMAKNVFKEDPEDFILKEKRGNILDTTSAGNTLRF